MVRPWYVVEVGEETRRGQQRLALVKITERCLRRPPAKGTANLYLKVVQADDHQNFKDEVPAECCLDPALWQQLPPLLVTKILLDHLPLDHIFRLADGDGELTASILLGHPLKRNCALLLPDRSLVLHNYSQVGHPPPRAWKRIHLHQQHARLFAFSQHGLLFFCSHHSDDGHPRLLCYRLADDHEYQAFVLEPFDFDGGHVDAAQVIHPKQQSEDYKLVILYAACTKAAVFDSRTRGWSKAVRPLLYHPDPRVLLSSPESAIEFIGYSDAQVILPLDLYCRNPMAEIRTADSTYTFLLAAVGKVTGNHSWDDDDADNGIDEASPVLLSGLKMDSHTGNWEIIPGPTQQTCGDSLNLAELRCIGVTDCLGVFATPRGELLTCLADPWTWYFTANPVKSWSYADRTIYAISP